MKIIFLPFFVLFACTFLYAQPGSLDQSFGTSGKVTWRYGDGEDTFEAVSVQSDGKIVVAGKNGDGRMIVARYDSSGNLDGKFANNGFFTLNLTGFNLSQAMAIQDDDKIVVVGLIRLSAIDEAFLTIRLTPDGQLDTSFNGNGIAQTNLTGGRDLARDVAIQSDGKIVVVGAAGEQGDAVGDIGLIRLNADGSLDDTFDGDGQVITTIGKRAEQGYAVKVTDGGNIFVLANSLDFDANHAFLAILAYDANGALDPGFGDQGISFTDLGSNRFSFGDLAVQADGKIVATASIGSNNSFTYTFTVLRFQITGAADASFGTNGKQTIVQGTTNSAQAVVIQPNGKITAVGHTVLAGQGLDIVLARLTPTGAFDAGFGTNGIVFTPVGSGNRSDYAFDAALQPDGKLLVSGDYNQGTLFDYDAVLLRYIGDSVNKNGTSVAADFDGDGRTDVSIFRSNPNSAIDDNFTGGLPSQWWYLRSSDQAVGAFTFGVSTDIPTPFDFTGDGKADVAFFRPSTGEWYVLRSEDFTFYAFPFGTTDDVPAPGDFDNDGTADATVYRPSTGQWFILRSSDSGVTAVPFGVPEDRPVVADFDGDGMDDVAVFRPSVREWWILNSSGGVSAYQFGSPGDIPVQGDYTGDGKADVAFFRPSTGEWYVLRSEDTSFFAFPWGMNGDVPVPGDYDGDGITDAAVWRESANGTWFINGSTSGFQTAPFGQAGDVPLPGYRP